MPTPHTHTGAHTGVFLAENAVADEATTNTLPYAVAPAAKLAKAPSQQATAYGGGKENIAEEWKGEKTA